MNKKLPIQFKITILSFLVVFFSLLIGGLIVISNVEQVKEEELRKRTMITARTVAQMPEIIRYVTYPKGWEIINPIVEKVRIINNADYIVVLNEHRMRYSHPIPSMLGTLSAGQDEAAAFAEHTYTSLAEGEAGLAVRAFVPIKNKDNKQVGVVIVGNLMPSFVEMFKTVEKDFAIIALLTVMFGIGGSWLLARHIKKEMFQLEPYEIVRMFEERTATFNAMHEGVVAIDSKEQITVFNEKAKEMLGISRDVSGKQIEDVLIDTRLPEMLNLSKAIYNQEIHIQNRNVMSTRIPIKVNNERIGAVAIFQDRTEVTKLAEELTGVKAFVEALRVQNHEHMNKLHTIAGLIQLGNLEQALNYVFHVTEEQEEVTKFLSEKFHHDSLSGLLLSKVSRGKELNIHVEIDRNSRMKQFPDRLDHHDFVLIVGNLIENSFAALEKVDHDHKKVIVSIEQNDQVCELLIEDNGIGIAEKDLPYIFNEGFTTKGEPGHGIGLNLVKQIVEKGLGEIEVNSNEGIGTSFVIRFPMQREGGNTNGKENI